MKKFKTLLLAGVILGTQGAAIAPAQATELSHYLVKEKAAPIEHVAVTMYNESGHTMVELSDVAEATEANVTYNYPLIKIETGVVTIELRIDSTKYELNGIPMTLPVAPTLKDAHVFLPLFDIVQVLGLDWHQDNNGILVSGKTIDIFSTVDIYGDYMTRVYKDEKNDFKIAEDGGKMAFTPFYNTDKSETMINYNDFAAATNTEIDYQKGFPWLTIRDGSNIFDFTIEDTLCTVNQKDSYRLSTAPIIKETVRYDKEVYLPAKEVAKLLGFNVTVVNDVLVFFR